MTTAKSGRSESGVPTVSVREASERLTAPDADTMLLDVREVWEYAPRRAKGAVNIPMSQLRRRVGEIPRDREVLVICEHGARSENVTRFLRQSGYDRAVNVDGGTEEWEQAGLPMDHGTW